MTDENKQELNGSNYSATELEERVVRIAWSVDALGPMAIGFSGLNLPEIQTELDNINSALLPLWYLSDLLGPSVLVILIATAKAKAFKSFMAWVIILAAFYLVWQNSKEFLASLHWGWTPAILVLIFLAIWKVKPSVSIASATASLGSTKVRRAAILFWRVCAAGYGIFLLVAVLTVPLWPIYLRIPFSFPELIASSTITIIIIRIWRRGDRLSQQQPAGA